MQRVVPLSFGSGSCHELCLLLWDVSGQHKQPLLHEHGALGVSSSEIFQWKQEREHSQGGWKVPSGRSLRPFQFPSVGEMSWILWKRNQFVFKGKGNKRRGQKKGRQKVEIAKQLWRGKECLEDISVCPEASPLVMSTVALWGSFSGICLLEERVPIWSLWGLGSISCLWDFSEPVGTIRLFVWVLVFTFLFSW